MDNENSSINNTLDPSENIIEPIKESKKPLVRKWIVVSLIITLVIASTVTIYLLVQTNQDNNVKNDDVTVSDKINDEVEINEEKLGEIIIDLEDGREIYISGIPHFHGEYYLVEDTDNVKIWEDNAAKSASTQYFIEYRESFDDFFEMDKPESVKSNSITYEYMVKEDADNIEEAARGVIINLENPIQINSYPIYEVIDYTFGPTGDDIKRGDYQGGDINKYSFYSVFCLIKLEDIFDNVDGGLLFSISDAMHYTNYFDNLTEDFSIVIND